MSSLIASAIALGDSEDPLDELGVLLVEGGEDQHDLLMLFGAVLGDEASGGDVWEAAAEPADHAAHPAAPAEHGGDRVEHAFVLPVRDLSQVEAADHQILVSCSSHPNDLAKGLRRSFGYRRAPPSVAR